MCCSDRQYIRKKAQVTPETRSTDILFNTNEYDTSLNCWENEGIANEDWMIKTCVNKYSWKIINDAVFEIRLRCQRVEMWRHLVRYVEVLVSFKPCYLSSLLRYTRGHQFATLRQQWRSFTSVSAVQECRGIERSALGAYEGIGNVTLFKKAALTLDGSRSCSQFVRFASVQPSAVESISRSLGWGVVGWDWVGGGAPQIRTSNREGASDEAEWKMSTSV